MLNNLKPKDSVSKAGEEFNDILQYLLKHSPNAKVGVEDDAGSNVTAFENRLQR